MKRIVMITAVVIAVLVGTLPAEARTFVLSVGVSEYLSPDVKNLQRSGKDAIAFSKIMKTQTADVTTVTGSNATRENIVAMFRAIGNRAQAGDRIVFFFSGHGGEGFVLAHDQPVYYSELSQLIRNSQASEVVCFIDACFSGTVAEDLRSTDKDLVFFLSSRPDEMSMEAPDWVGAGYLTQALAKGIQGKADSDRDKQVTVIELFKYIYGDVLARVEQANRYLDSDAEPIVQHPQLIAAKKSYGMVLADWRE